ncbi:MAG TPA: glycine cleavage system protein GcvH [Candidatus Limivivens merdigallinarum]|uniref:Glycine cleavage system H protein n=1 Tax=Candidatus Limivivens merdigallinarum TaxID=2840859 RepID=A0A9D1D028_9FIRM|nr:glycine cleavage system protein GcvH [Candidatus Limivivens merdigallinarum]
MNYPKELCYVKSHEWVKKEDGTVLIGITDYAQDALGDLVFVNLPEVGDEVVMGEAFADVESVKAVSDVYSPVSGVVKEINEALLDQPELINENPYEAWFIRVEQITEEEEYMNAEEYQEFAESEE